MSLSYVAPLSRSSCVSACCVANYMSPHIPNVVMAKQSILEFYNRKRDRLVLVDTIRMVSVIKLITDFKPYVEKDNNTCNYLFIVMDNGLVQVLKYHNGSHILYSDELKKQEPMFQGKTDSPLVAKNSDGSIILLRPATSLDIIAYVVPERRHDSVNRNDQLRATTNRHSPLSSCETGEKVSGGSLDDIFDRITTIAMFGQKVRDIAFVPNSDILATACHTGPETSFLEFSTLDSLANPKVLIKQFSHPEIHSSHGKMCPVKGPYNGLLYITEKCIFFYWNGCKNIRIRSFGNRKLHHLLHGPCCCVQVDTDRFLVNFYSGSLFLLKILGPSNLGVPTSNKVDFAYLGSIYQESYLQLLSSKYFLATSKKGHITVYRLNQKKIVPVRDVENIPPVIALDSFVDSNTDSVCLLTSCTTSTKKNPSLKLISSSLLLDDSFELEGLDGVVGIWPYENYTTGQKYVVVSYIKYSDIFRLSCSSKGQGEVELEPKQGLNFKFDRYINTLCFGTIAINFDDGSNGRVAVQITPKNIIVTDLATTDLEPWSPGWVSLGSEITLGYISKDHILVCLDSSTVCLLDATLSIIAVTEFDSPVSAMCYNNEYLAVSFWQCSEAISIYVVSKISDSFNYLCSVPSDSDHVQPELIRSIEIVGNQILIGTANGLLHRYELTVDYVAEDSEGSPSSLRHIQTWVVGSTPVTLTKFRHQIFSISDNLCILEIKIKDNDGKPITDWLTSPHRIKLDPSTGPPRSIISYDDSTFVLAFTNTLRVGDIGSFSNLYVENWPQEDVVSDICYLSEDLAFVVVLDADLTSQVKLLDVKEFKCLDTMILYSGHCLSLLLLKNLVKSDSDEMTYFVMGSFAEYPLAEDPLLESNKPHLALFTIDSTQKEIEMEDIYVNGDRVTNLTQAAEPDQLYASCASEVR